MRRPELSGAHPIETDTDMTHTVIELAEARLRADVTDAQLAVGIASSDRFLTAQDGFVARRSLREGAALVDLIEWRDATSARKAAQAAETSPHCAPFFQLFEPGSGRMRHLTLIA